MMLRLEVPGDWRRLVQLDKQIDRPETNLLRLVADPNVSEVILSTVDRVLALEDQDALREENAEQFPQTVFV